MIKKTACGIIILSMLVMLTFITVNADPLTDHNGGEIGIQRFTYISYFLNSLQVKNGQAVVTSCLSASDVDQVRISVYLQRFTDGYWFPVTNWTSTRNGTYISMNEYYDVEPGYSYRIVSYGYALIGGYIVESTSYTGSPVYY